MAHFRCPTSSIVGSTGRYPYTSGDSIHYSSTSTQLVFEQDPSDQDDSSDESISSSSSSTILASSRPLPRSSPSSPHPNHSAEAAAPTMTAARVTPAAGTSSTTTIHTRQPYEDDKDRRCWICYGEDGDSEGKWVSPCPCSLVAHEKCLLDWITENQKGSPRKIVSVCVCSAKK